MPTVETYALPQVIQLTLTGQTAASPAMTNYPMNRTDFSIYKNVLNEVHVFVMDVDRRPVTLVSNDLTIAVTERGNGRLVMQAPLTVANANSNIAKLTVTADQTNAFEAGQSYTWQIVRAGSPLYTDRNYGSNGVVLVRPGPYGSAPSATEVPWSAFTQNGGTWFSTALRGAAATGNRGRLHQVVIHADGMDGLVTIQASLEGTTTVAAPGGWFDVATLPVLPEDTIITHSFVASVLWVRFSVILNDGSLTKIAFKN